jgi:hypothetical protein
MAATGVHAETSASSVHFDSDAKPIGVDTQCSATMSSDINDFVPGSLQPSNRTIKGYGGVRDNNVMVGTRRLQWSDDNGKVFQVDCPNSYYTPNGKVRLLCPQHFAQCLQKQRLGKSHFTAYSDHMIWTWTIRGETYHKTIPVDPVSNVFTFHTAPGYNTFSAFCSEAGITDESEDSDPLCFETNVVSDDEDSDEPFESDNEEVDAKDSQIVTEFDLDGKTDESLPRVVEDEEERQTETTAAELLRYHHKFGHVSFSKLQVMAKHGIIPKRLAKCPVPTCSACLFGKAKRRPWRSKTTENKGNIQKPIKPGQVVSVDQMISQTPGLIAQMIGFLTKRRYKVATVFVDQATSTGYVHLQSTTSADESVEAKKAFERFAKVHGVERVQHYHADNGIFASVKWRQALAEQGQTISFAGVNAHHQNGVAERRIQELTNLARTMLIHAGKRWSKAITANLWPYAIRMANDVLNATPNSADEIAPIAKWSNSPVSTNPKHWQPFGCPVYVLDEELQTAGASFSKWKERARVGVYLGRSPMHGRQVALVLNLQTGHVSPQFHIKFDPSFQTVRNEKSPPSRWQEKCGFVEVVNDAPRAPVSTQEPPSSNGSQTAQENSSFQVPSALPTDQDQSTNSTVQDTVQQRQGMPSSEGDSGGTDIGQVPRVSGAQAPVTSVTTTRTGRTVRPTQRLIEAMKAELAADAMTEGEIFSLQAVFPDDAFVEVFKATADPDTMYWHEAMKEPDREEFLKAAQKEVDDQVKNGNFSIVKRSELPKDARVLPAVWAMRRKRRIKTGEIYKWKARLNIDGSKQRPGIDYWETYSPVASWSSVRLLLTMVITKGWHTRQIDYVQAYTQAPVEKVTYMAIPKGFEVQGGDPDDYVLQIHKNIYGQCQAGRVWNQHLVRKLKMVGFKQSTNDECIFYRGQVMYVLYTDDSILAGPSSKELDEIVKMMKQVGLDLTVDGDISDFLGVNIEKYDDGTIHLTQPHLIDSILQDLRLTGDNVKTQRTPAASSKVLSRHLDSEVFDNHFNYRRVIGKLLYLEKGSRPELAYAVHQCARFSADPRKEHGEAVKWIGRYLKGTRDKGLILKLNDSSLEVFVDANFSGDWNQSTAENDPDTARSRYAFYVFYAGCPIIWASRMQTEIALSTTEAEFYALSYALREVIPLIELLKELDEAGFNIVSTSPKVHCRVFEDNSGAIELARLPKYRPRTKHINIRYHHFRHYVENGQISLHAIDSDRQAADIGTKPLNADLFERHRKCISKW